MSVPFEGVSKPLCMIISGKQPSRSCYYSRSSPTRTLRIAGRTVEANVMIFCRELCPTTFFLRVLCPITLENDEFTRET